MIKRARPFVLLLGAALTVSGCKDLTFGQGPLQLTGTWTGPVEPAGKLVIVLAHDESEVIGAGVLTSDSTSLALEVAAGLYVHPSVSIVMASDSGTFNLIGNRSAREEPLLYGIEPVTITGELNGPGFFNLEIVLTRLDSVASGP